MGRTAGRTPEQTRRQALDAAAVVFRTQGVSATLEDVAKAAGLSKGGVVYHFGSKDKLLQLLVSDLIDSWRAAVEAALDPDDHQPGRLARAYIRACLESDAYVHELRDGVILSAQLAAQPEIAAALAADTERWTADLQADGLPDDVLQLVISAADGGSTALLWGGEIVGGDSAALCRTLIALTRAPRSLTTLVNDTENLRADS